MIEQLIAGFGAAITAENLLFIAAGRSLGLEGVCPFHHAYPVGVTVNARNGILPGTVYLLPGPIAVVRSVGANCPSVEIAARTLLETGVHETGSRRPGDATDKQQQRETDRNDSRDHAPVSTTHSP